MQEISLGLTMFRGIKQQVLSGLGERGEMATLLDPFSWLYS